ncbi:MAG: choice-of-anchor D domain-containing protein [Bacteroidales bacterium]|nr:choice-of-anchor D domain-containing protein [Bacteroidales bacterium]
MKKFTFFLFLVIPVIGLYAQPDLSVSLDKVSDVLANGETSVRSFTIKNNGDVALKWSIDLKDSLSNGPDVSFVKMDNTDWTLKMNQDRITNSVWITRDLTKSLFNAKSEAASEDFSPQGTLWSLGSANETVPDSNFTSFNTAHGGNPRSLIGDTITLFLVNEGVYYDVGFTSYSGGGTAGGFAYTRRQMMPWFSVSQNNGTLAPAASVTVNVTFFPSDLAVELHSGTILINSNDPDTPQDTVAVELDILSPAVINVQESKIVDTLVSGTTGTFDLNIENTGLAGLYWNIINPVTITKINYADYNLEENQDRITEDVWITRQNEEGLYNIARETSYDRGGEWKSPLGTQWAYGKTVDVTPEDYTTWRASYRNKISTHQLPGKTLSLKIEGKEIYYDVLFNQWTSSGNGGGFSYTRTRPIPKWMSGTLGGTVSGGNTSTITYTLNATGMNEGNYSYDLEIRSNDPAQPLVIVPVTMVVQGIPEILTDSYNNYGNVFLGVPKTFDLAIENTGSKALTVNNIAADSMEFVPLISSVTIQPGEQESIPVVFTPSHLGFIRDTLRIASNDPGTPVVKCVVEGTGIDLPDISLSSYLLTDTLKQDSVSVDTIIMTNNGETNLVWSINTDDNIAYDRSGFLINFAKEPNANIDYIENRDSITLDISLTGNDGGLYDYNGGDIEWAMGSSFEAIQSKTVYTSDWRSAMGDQAANLPGKTISLHIIDEDMYVDINILSWGSRQAGNGYSYTRSVPMPNWLVAEGEISGTDGTLAPGESEKIVVYHDASGIMTNGVYNGRIVLSTNVPSKPEVVISDILTVAGTEPMMSIDTTFVSAKLIAEGVTEKTITVTNNGTGKLIWNIGEPAHADSTAHEKVVFYKFNNADWTLRENQDRITDRVWLTRAENGGVFNIAQENAYDRNNNTSPAGTEWAYGYTLELSPDDYDTWYNLHNQNTPEIVGQPVSLHLTEEDLYFDILFTGWQMNNNGGGFSYIRSAPYMPLTGISVSPRVGLVLPGESQVISVFFDASGLVAGTRNFEMNLTTNDADHSDVIITGSLEVLGHPEIQLQDTALAFGDSYIGHPVSMKLTINNNGNEVLNITDISFNEPAFSVAEPLTGIAPFDKDDLIVAFNAALEKTYTGTMTIVTDDPVNQSVDVSLSGRGVVAPAIAVNVTELSEALFHGEIKSQKLVVTNTGMGVLDWKLGPEILETTFAKTSSADYHLPMNQDRIVEDVWITRGMDKGLFNIARESSYDRSSWVSPLGTEWAYGKTGEVDPSDYTTWREAVRNDAGISTYNLPGRTFSLKLTDYDLYYDVTFLEWERNGGAFSYHRKFAGSVSNSWVLFSEESGSLAVGQSDTITVIFNPSADVPAGNYSFDMAVWSNDPDGSVNIPITLSIDDVVAVRPFADTLVQEGFISYAKDVSSIFLSRYGNTFTYSAQSEDESIAKAEIAGNVLTITEKGTGTTGIVINALTELGESGNQTFELRINDVPSADTLPDVRYPNGFVSANLDLSGVFSDSDHDVQNITASSSLETVVTVSLTDEILTISEAGSGVSAITLNTSDGSGGTANTSFLVRINSAPVVSGPISNVVVDENFNIHVIDIADVFTDSDSDPLTLTALSNNENVAVAFVNGTDLVLMEAGTGTANITVSASDEIALTPASTTFDVTVNPATGIASTAQTDFEIFPNPSDGNITLILQDFSRGDVYITVVDMKGVQVFVDEINVFDSRIELNLTSLKRGVYLMQLRSDNSTRYNRLVIE